MPDPAPGVPGPSTSASTAGTGAGGVTRSALTAGCTQQDAQGRREFKPKTLVLSEAIGDRLIVNSFEEGPGIVEVEYTGSPNIGGGTYRMWLEVRTLS